MTSTSIVLAVRVFHDRSDPVFHDRSDPPRNVVPTSVLAGAVWPIVILGVAQIGVLAWAEHTSHHRRSAAHLGATTHGSDPPNHRTTVAGGDSAVRG